MGALILPAVSLVALWGSGLWRLLSSGRAISLFHGWVIGLAYFLVLPFSIISLNGGYAAPEYYRYGVEVGYINLHDERYFLPYVFVWITLVAVGSVVLFLTVPRGSECRTHDQFVIREGSLERLALICVGLTMFDIAANVSLHGGIQEFLLSHWYRRDEEMAAKYGEAFVLYSYLGRGLKLALAGAACIAVYRKLTAGRGGWPLIATVSAMLLSMVATGNRIYLALFFFYVGCTLVLLRRYRAIIKFALVAPFLIVIFGVWTQVRGALSDPAGAIENHLEAAGSYEESYVMNRIMDVTEGNSVIVLLNVVKDFGARYQYLSGSTFLKAFVFPIPRSVYPHKPDNFPTVTARLYAPGEDTALSSSVVGELYGNFGPYTLFLLPLMTALIYVLDSWILSRRRFGALLSMVLFLSAAWMARAAFSDGVIGIGFAIFVIKILGLERGLIVQKQASRLAQADS